MRRVHQSSRTPGLRWGPVCVVISHTKSQDTTNTARRANVTNVVAPCWFKACWRCASRGDIRFRGTAHISPQDGDPAEQQAEGCDWAACNQSGCRGGAAMFAHRPPEPPRLDRHRVAAWRRARHSGCLGNSALHNSIWWFIQTKGEWVSKFLQRKMRTKTSEMSRRPSFDQAVIELPARQTQALF